MQFSNFTSSAGIQFRHENGATPDKYLPETMGAGAVFFDYDSDGWLDIFLVNGGSFSDAGKAARAQHRLYRNTGAGVYRDVTGASGIAAFGYGMGACSADYDNDGWADLIRYGDRWQQALSQYRQGSFYRRDSPCRRRRRHVELQLRIRRCR